MSKEKYLLGNANRSILRLQYNSHRIAYMLDRCVKNDRAVIVNTRADLVETLRTLRNQVAKVDFDVCLMLCPLIAPFVRQILDSIDWHPMFEVTSNERMREHILCYERAGDGDVIPHYLIVAEGAFGPGRTPLSVVNIY